MPLTEVVEVWTSEPGVRNLGEGTLEVSGNGLPMLLFPDDEGRGDWVLGYTAATLPAVWSLRAPRNTWPGVLLEAWLELEQIRERIAVAEREAEGEDNERDQAQQRETDARIAEEVERQRGEADA